VLQIGIQIADALDAEVMVEAGQPLEDVGVDGDRERLVAHVRVDPGDVGSDRDRQLVLGCLRYGPAAAREEQAGQRRGPRSA
jgi:hypothetical protein